MNESRLKAIAEAVAEYGIVTRDAMLVLRMTIGRQMAEAIAAGECKTVQGAIGAASGYVQKVTGRLYGAAWWRTCYLYHSKLTPEWRTIILDKHIPPKIVDRAVNASPAVMEELLVEGTKDRKRWHGRVERRRPSITDFLDRDGKDHDLVLSRPFDEEKVRNVLASILGDIRVQRSPLSVPEFDRLVLDAKRQAGIGRS